MRRSLLSLAIIVITFGLLPLGVSAEQALSPEALEIANSLNCPVCEGQSIRDSNSQLARDMRRTIQDMLDEGYTEEEIEDYFVDRYGVGILRDPPKDGFFMTLWWAPVVGLAIGALVLGTFVTQRRTRSSGEGTDEAGSTGSGAEERDDDLSRYEERVLRDLDDDSNNENR